MFSDGDIMKVSIIVPFYNVEKYIERCLNSILEQTYQDLEIICVDDYGTDKSIEIAERIASQHPEVIRIVTNGKNNGLGAARDLGMKYASGEYIMFIDSDDYIAKDYVEKYISVIKNTGMQYDLVAGGYIREENGIQKAHLLSQKESELWLFCSACCRLYRREFLEENHLDFRGIRRYEDEPFCYRLLLARPKFHILSYVGYYYVLNEQSLTQSKNIDRTQAFLTYADMIRKVLEEFGKRDDLTSSEKELLAYSIRSRLIASLLYNARGCGIRRMGQLYKTYDKLMRRVDRITTKRSDVSSLKKHSSIADAKTHYASWLVVQFRRFRSDKVLFLLDSKL